MRWTLACLAMLLILVAVGCKKPAESVQVTKNNAGVLSGRHFIPSSGGRIEWYQTDYPFQIVPNVAWPCKLKPASGIPDEKSKTVSCEFPSVGSTDWQEWWYKIRPLTKQQPPGANTSTGSATVTVGHCQNCDAVPIPVQPARPNGTNIEANITCPNDNDLMVAPDPISTSAGATVTWDVNGTDPNATLTFNPPSSCTPNPATGNGTSQISCTVQSAGTYTVDWKSCQQSTQKTFTISVGQKTR